jgi:hypothetical protein
MPDLWKPQPIDVYRSWCDFILCHGKDVTPWEQEFTKDISARLERGRHLTQAQAYRLTHIYAEKT